MLRRYSISRLALTALIAVHSGLWDVGSAAPSTILVMGDSLSAAYGMPLDKGWVTLLQTRLKMRGYKLRVVNASISGETTSGGLARLPQTLQEHDPDLVIIELGANDGLRGLHPDQLNHNLTRIVELSEQHGARVLLTGVRIPANYGKTFQQLYYAQYRAVAEQTGAPLVPFLLQDVAQNPALMQDDGLHPNAQAQPKILENVWPRLEPLLQ